MAKFNCKKTTSDFLIAQSLFTYLVGSFPDFIELPLFTNMFKALLTQITHD